MISRRDMRSELVLSEALEDLRGYDFVLLDTAPSWDVLNVNCLFYVEELLIPVSMEALALQGVGDLIGRVDQVQQYRPDRTLQKNIIPTFYDGRVRKSSDAADEIPHPLQRQRLHGDRDQELLDVKETVDVEHVPRWRRVEQHEVVAVQAVQRLAQDQLRTHVAAGNDPLRAGERPTAGYHVQILARFDLHVG